MKTKAIFLVLIMGICLMACGKEAENTGAQTEERKDTVITQALEGKENVVTEAPERTDDPVVTQAPEVTEAPAVEKNTEENTPVEEVQQEEQNSQVPEGVKIYETSKSYNQLKYECDTADRINAFYYQKEATVPYYLGRDDENTKFLDKNRESGDGVLYLGLPLHLPSETIGKAVCFSISDESVATIVGDELIGLKQGEFVLSSYDADKNHIEDKKYWVTTYNDSKEDIAQAMTISKVPMGDFTDAYDIDYWKSAICTIQDMSYFLQARFFRYDFYKEPKLASLEHQGDENRWVWEADAETIFDMNGGVCIQVAQLATYMLAGDYEDWGVVMVSGNQGHIFNWFYEDGNYYLFDFTEVISYNAYNKDYNTPEFYQYVDFSDSVVKRDSIEGIRNYCTTRKVDLSQNYLIYMYSCKGHDYLPCSLNTGMSDSNGVLNGYYDQVIMGYQDVVMEDLVILYEKEESNVEFRSYKKEEIPMGVLDGIYYDTKEIKYYYNY